MERKELLNLNMKKRNLFENIPSGSKDEVFEEILKKGNVKIERIISTGQSTPLGEWYDQDLDEWVILLKGSAELLFEDNERITMMPGDYVHIPPHCRHRVEWTDEKQPTVWLAVHFSQN